MKTSTSLFKILLLLLLAEFSPFIAKAQDTTDCILHTAPGTDTILVDVYDSGFVEPQVTGTDDQSTTVPVQRTGDIDITKLGNYTITYTGTDGAGNTCTFVRVIKVVDRIKPVMICLPLTVKKGTAIDPFVGVGADDNYNFPQDFINKTNGCRIEIVSNNVNPNVEGIYEICYVAIDQSGNTSDTCCSVVSMVTSCPSVDGFGFPIDIYPNPTNGKFEVLLKEDVEAITIKIINLTGQTIKTYTELDIANGKIAVDLTGETAGIYFIQIIHADKGGFTRLSLSK